MSKANRIFIAMAVAAVVLVWGLAGTSVAGSPVAELYRQSYRLEAAGQPGQALATMQQIEAQAGSSYFVHARSAWLAYLANRQAESEAAYRKAISAAPGAIEPRLGLTLPLLATAQWRPLELACRDVLKLDPKNAVARARLAHAHYMVGNYPDSATLYRELCAEYPANLDHQTGLGWALARMGRGQEAKRIFAAVLAVSPDNPNAKQGAALP